MSDLRGGCPLAAACVKRSVAVHPRQRITGRSIELTGSDLTWVAGLMAAALARGICQGGGRRIHGRHRTPGLTGLSSRSPRRALLNGAINMSAPWPGWRGRGPGASSFRPSADALELGREV